MPIAIAFKNPDRRTLIWQGARGSLQLQISKTKVNQWHPFVFVSLTPKIKLYDKYHSLD